MGTDFFILIFHYQRNKFFSNFVDWSFQLIPGILQLLTNLDVLRTVLFALAAANAVGSRSRVLSQNRAHHVFPQSGDFAVGIADIVGRKGAGNVHAFGTRHTVAAAGTAHLHFLIDIADDLIQKILIRLAQLTGTGRGGIAAVFLYHFQ